MLAAVTVANCEVKEPRDSEDNSAEIVTMKKFPD